MTNSKINNKLQTYADTVPLVNTILQVIRNNIPYPVWDRLDTLLHKVHEKVNEEARPLIEIIKNSRF